MLVSNDDCFRCQGSGWVCEVDRRQPMCHLIDGVECGGASTSAIPPISTPARRRTTKAMARFTPRNGRPVKVVYSESHDLLDAAIARERQLKRWTTAKTEALIAGDLATLKSRSVQRRK